VDLTREGEIVVAVAVVGGLALGVLLSLVPLTRLWQTLLAIVPPIIAVAVFVWIDPGGPCDYDCIGRAFWGLIVALGIVSWFVGFGLSAMVRNRSKGG
jgi:hypothetical protein